MAVVLALWAAGGCASTEAERRQAAAVDRLYGGLHQQMDGLLLQWSAAYSEKNRTAEMIYRGRMTALLRRDENLFAVQTGAKLSDATVVATCAAALGFTDAPGMGESLAPLLAHAEGRVRAGASLALVQRDGEGCPLPAAMTLLGDTDAVVRQHAALLAAMVIRRHRGAADYDEALLAYMDALTDLDPQVRVHAAKGLGEIGDVAAAPVLVERGLADALPMVRATAASALAALKAQPVAEDVLAAYEREFNPHVRRGLNRALQAITGLEIEALEQWKEKLPAWRKRMRGEAEPAPAAVPAGPTEPTKPADPPAKSGGA